MDEINATRELKPGDVIWANRIVKGLPYNHCGIYKGAGVVIHFAPKKGFEISMANAVIHETTLEAFSDGCPIKIVDFPEGFSPEETLRRAKARIGERGYDFTVNNCDHFATWCKTGEHRSLQVDLVKSVIKVAGGEVGEMICAIHDVAESSFKAARFGEQNRIHQPREIQERLTLNSSMTVMDPPVSDGMPVDDEAPAGKAGAGEEAVKYKIIEKVPLEEINKKYGKEDKGGGAPEKKPWYELVGEVLKGITYPIAAGLELAKRILPVPPFVRKISFTAHAAKVRNGIDNVVTSIKVFTGRLDPLQGQQEMQNNETALLGSTVAQKQRQPVGQTVKQVFGKAGTFIKHTVQQVVNRIVPEPVRESIKNGFQKTGHAVVSGVKAVVNAGRTVVNTVVKGLARIGHALGFGTVIRN